MSCFPLHSNHIMRLKVCTRNNVFIWYFDVLTEVAAVSVIQCPRVCWVTWIILQSQIITECDKRNPNFEHCSCTDGTISALFILINFYSFYIWNHLRIVCEVADSWQADTWRRVYILNNNSSARFTISLIDGDWLPTVKQIILVFRQAIWDVLPIIWFK